MDEEGKDNPDVTVKDPPTLTLPEVVRVEPVIVPKLDNPETDNPPNVPTEVTVNDLDIPTLPVTSSSNLGVVKPIPTLPPEVTTKAEEPEGLIWNN